MREWRERVVVRWVHGHTKIKLSCFDVLLKAKRTLVLCQESISMTQQGLMMLPGHCWSQPHHSLLHRLRDWLCLHKLTVLVPNTSQESLFQSGSARHLACLPYANSVLGSVCWFPEHSMMWRGLATD